MKTQEEYAHEIDEIVRRDVDSCQSDWFDIHASRKQGQDIYSRNPKDRM